MRQNIILAAALALLAVSCGKDSGQGTPSSGREIRVSPAVTAATRGSQTTAGLESFDLLVSNPRSPRYSYTNTRLTKGGDGKWSPASPMLWERPAGEAQEVDLLALSPALADGGHSLGDSPIMTFEVEAEQSAESRRSDLLYFSLGADAVSWTDTDERKVFNDNKELIVRFSHAMSLLKIEITLGSEFNHNGVPESNPVSGLRVGGTVRRATFQYNGGSCAVTPTGDAAEPVAAYETGWSPAANRDGRCRATYECVLVPQTARLSVSFMVAGIPYRWTGDAALVMGQSRVLPLTVGRDEVVAGEMTAQPWTDGGENDIETE